jgi:hypothetical protein
LLCLHVITGDVIFLHCNTLYKSDVNTSDERRMAFLPVYNRKSNSPVKEGIHPGYLPLDVVSIYLSVQDLWKCRVFQRHWSVQITTDLFCSNIWHHILPTKTSNNYVNKPNYIKTIRNCNLWGKNVISLKLFLACNV